MTQDPAASIDRAFVEAVRALEAEGAAPPRDRDAPLRPGTGLLGRVALELFDAQIKSRHLDLEARRLRARGAGYYTIGSSGHEGNVAVAEATRVTDPAFLHYRSGAFFLHRARRAGYPSAVRDVLLGIVASREEPIAGGRHKVFGSARLSIPPQTSTIASHLPKAVGTAVALDRRKKLATSDPATPADALVVCSFGDASLGHSTAAGALNAACSAAWQRLPVPILFVCEDNGIGISVPTPPGFIAATYQARPGLAYFAADGCDLCEAYDAAMAAAACARKTRRPAFLHLRTVRLMGHAGADLEAAYRSAEAIRASEARDPVLASARLLAAAGVATPAALLARYEAAATEVRLVAEDAASRPRLETAAEVVAPLAPREPARIALAAAPSLPLDAAARRRFWGDRLPEEEAPQPLAGHVNATLGDLLVERPELLVFGEDVGPKGGVYGVTKGLHRRAGAARVFDTILDEQAILGLAIGAGQLGLLPIPEIQYLAYVHNALDQIRGEASSIQFFSQGRFRNPMVVRIAAYAYQKGFGGHFHNDDSVAALRDIPGLVIASPSRGDDAAAMLRTCVAAAAGEGSVCLFLEPIALYRTLDLHAPGDGLHASPYRPRPDHVPIGRARVHGEGSDLLLVSFANGLWMSLRAARRLEAEGIHARVLDLRWLLPLPVEDLEREAARAGRVLVVDETRRSGGVSEAVITALVDAGFQGAMRRVTSLDTFVPLGPAADLVLVQEEAIVLAAREMLGGAIQGGGRQA